LKEAVMLTLPGNSEMEKIGQAEFDGCMSRSPLPGIICGGLFPVHR